MNYHFTDAQVENLRLFVTSFASPGARDRLLSLLETKKGRHTVFNGLDHVGWLDPKYATHLPNGSIDLIERMLLTRGAPESCEIMSTDRTFNNRTMPLGPALAQVVSGVTGTIVICRPGRLAYYEGEGPGEHYICSR